MMPWRMFGRCSTQHCPNGSTYLENLFRIRPLGVVSKKFIGERKMACAILSCSLREAYRSPGDTH